MRRFAVVAVVLTLIGIITPGCLTADQQARMDKLTSELPALEAKAEELLAAVRAGTIPYSDGLELYKEVKDTASQMRAEIATLKAEGASGWEIFAGILSSVAASLTGVRLWRGASHSYLDAPKAAPAG